MKSFSKEEISNLAQNPEQFKQAIIESKGFILYLADKEKTELTPELLINSISPYSIRFISEHMKTHKYSKEQTEIVVSYLKEDDYEEDEAQVIEDYNLINLLHDLKEENELPKNLKKWLELTFDDFLNNSKVLSRLVYHSDSDFWNDYFIATHELLQPLFDNISKEDFLKIDPKTLSSCPALFFMAKHLMNDQEIKNLFNLSANQFYEIPDIKKGGYRIRLENYRHYPFNEKEKELFLSLLKNEYSTDYESIKKMKGFNKFFTKNEYIFNHNISGIQYLSKKEIAENLSTIRKSLIAAYIPTHYKNVEKFYDLKIQEDSFKDIFTPEYIKEIVNLLGGFKFHYFDKDNQDKTTKMNLMHKSVTQLCAEDNNILSQVGFQNVLNNIVSLIENNRKYFDEDYSIATKSILNKFDQAILPEMLFKNTDSNKIKCFTEFDVPEFLVAGMKGKESINYLYALMKFVKEGNNWRSNTYTEEINRIIPLLNQNDVKTIAKMLDYKIDKTLIVKNLLNNVQRQDYENNFLNFNPEIIQKMSFSTFSKIFSISEDFRKMIIDQNLDHILINEKIINKENRYNDFIGSVLSSIKDTKSTYYPFMKAFIKNNHDFMLEHYFSDLITHPLREKLIKINTKELEKDSYNKIETILFSSQNSDDGCDTKKLVSNISFDFYAEKIKQADVLKAIQLYKINSEGFKDIVFDKIENLDFNTTKELLSNKLFLTFIFNNRYNDSSNYRDENKRFLFLNPKFSNQQNVEIVESLLQHLNNKDLFVPQYESKVELNKILYLIQKDRRVEISNDLVIKHDPAQMFNSYDYLPKESGSFDRHVQKTFTTEQIMQAINNLNKQGNKIICIGNNNVSHDNLLSHNYNYEGRDGKNPELNNYLNLLKNLENDPINYLACIHSDIIGNFLDNKKFENSDIAKSEFYNNHINIEVVLQAMKEIFAINEEFNNSEQCNSKESILNGVAVKNSLKAVTNFIAFTYYSRDGKVISEFNEDKSEKILKTILEHAPYLFLSIPYIGKLGATVDEVTGNFDKYFNPRMVENFFLRSGKAEITDDHFSLSYEKRKEYWQSKAADEFMISLINNLTIKQDGDNLSKIDFIIKENKFNEQRPYGKHLNDFSTPLGAFICNDSYEVLIEKSLAYMSLLNLPKKESPVKVRSKI